MRGARRGGGAGPRHPHRPAGVRHPRGCVPRRRPPRRPQPLRRAQSRGRPRRPERLPPPRL
eukprot:2213499-Pyramimonas_sp.AAC.1